MLLPWKQLRQAVSDHFCCRDLAYGDASRLHFLSQLEVVNIDVPELRVEASIVGIDQTNSSFIIAFDSENVRCLETHSAEQSSLPLEMLAGFR
jgi:hypothetical protein